MPLTAKEVADLKRLVKQEAEGYPDLAALLAAGRLTVKAGWYRANDKEARDTITRWASSIRIAKDGSPEIKLGRPPSKRLMALAEKL